MTVDGTWITGASVKTQDGTFDLTFDIPSDSAPDNYLLGLASSDTDYDYTDRAPYVLVE